MNACYVNEANLDKPFLTLFTRRDVLPWEELCFSYTGYDSDEEVCQKLHYTVCCIFSLFYYRMMKINMSTMEMLCMRPVYVGPKSVKDTCLSKLSIV
jgi:hypothetical protein